MPLLRKLVHDCAFPVPTACCRPISSVEKILLLSCMHVDVFTQWGSEVLHVLVSRVQIGSSRFELLSSDVGDPNSSAGYIPLVEHDYLHIIAQRLPEKIGRGATSDTRSNDSHLVKRGLFGRASKLSCKDEQSGAQGASAERLHGERNVGDFAVTNANCTSNLGASLCLGTELGAALAGSYTNLYKKALMACNRANLVQDGEYKRIEETPAAPDRWQ